MYDEANRRANERTINFLKSDPRNAIFVVDEKLCNIHNKQINAAIKAINDFCRAGREGYERLALVIVSDGATANISSEVSTGNVNYVNQDNSALKWLMEGPSSTTAG